MPIETSQRYPAIQEQPSSEVTLHLAPVDADLPFRRVAGITTTDESWRDGHVDPGTELEAFAVSLPDAFSKKVVEFAMRHIGPEATDKETSYFCHTFAEAVGSTAVRSAAPEAAGMRHGGQKQAGNIFAQGAKIEPHELNLGEHGVIGNPATTEFGQVGLEHSMVGIGDGRAIQIDGPNTGPHSGHLYIGRPKDYIDWLNNMKNQGSESPLALYAHREEITQPAERTQGHIGKLGTLARTIFRPRRRMPTSHEPAMLKDPNNPWA